MAIRRIKVWIAECDNKECGKNFEICGDNAFETKGETVSLIDITRYRKNGGWQYKKDKVYCPECREEKI